MGLCLDRKSTNDLTKDYVVILGELNNTPDSDALQPLLMHWGVHDVFGVGGHPADGCWSY